MVRIRIRGKAIIRLTSRSREENDSGSESSMPGTWIFGPEKLGELGRSEAGILKG